MKLMRAQVQNYRSVEDANEFPINDGATHLVGKNGSGTALLTALERLNRTTALEVQLDRQRDYPRRYLRDYDERHPTGAALQRPQRTASRAGRAAKDGGSGIGSSTVAADLHGGCMSAVNTYSRRRRLRSSSRASAWSRP